MADDDYETDAVPRSLELSGRQLTLRKALADFHAPLADWYAGAILVLGADGPDRLALSAHSIREIIEYLPRVMDAPMASAHRTYSSEAGKLRERWRGALKNSKSLIEGKWEGPIDGPLVTLLAEVARFCEWMENERPTKRVAAARLVRAMDNLPLPEVLVDQNAVWYLKMRTFFVRVAHHDPCDEVEFVKWMNAFEVFVLTRLNPRTFEEFTEIDELIEGDASADAG